MGRENIDELLRNGVPLTFVAEKLGVSRPTLYRQIELYKNSEDQKMIDSVREYFDMLVMGKIQSEEEARKQLEQMAYLADAKGESKVLDIRRARDDLMIAQHEYYSQSDSMTVQERVEAEIRLEKMRDSIRELEDDLDEGPARDRFGRRIDRLVWNDGEIRSAVQANYDSARIFIDADYDRCRSVWVEISVDISGKNFTFGRERPEENRKYVDIGSLPGNAMYRYRLRWTEDDRQKTAGPYEIIMDTEF